MVSVFFWVAFGSIIGWVAAILQDETVPRRVLTHITIGIIGGLLGGYGGALLTPTSADYQSTATDIMFAVFGAIVLVWAAGVAADKRSEH